LDTKTHEEGGHEVTLSFFSFDCGLPVLPALTFYWSFSFEAEFLSRKV